MEAEIEGSPAAPVVRLLRDRSGSQRVTNIELFFDLVYVFAITRLSRPSALAAAPGHHVSRMISARKRAVSAGVSASALSWFMTSR